jgi:hypothetical protein
VYDDDDDDDEDSVSVEPGRRRIDIDMVYFVIYSLCMLSSSFENKHLLLNGHLLVKLFSLQTPMMSSSIER